MQQYFEQVGSLLSCCSVIPYSKEFPLSSVEISNVSSIIIQTLILLIFLILK